MSKRAYGQYCGFARALELVGERWAFMIVRDLLVEPKRFGDLHRGLKGIPTNILTSRLKELEQAGIVRRRVLPRPSGAVVYELTEVGQGLEPSVRALGTWGAKLLGDPRANEIVTPDSLVTALRTTFQPAAAGGVNASFELRFGEIVLHARVAGGAVDVARGPLPDADLVIETGPALRPLLARELTPREALKSGAVRVTGKRALLGQFVELFSI